MNPATEPASSAAAAMAPPQQQRPSTTCDRHPNERFTGFCPSCLCERLAVLDQTNNGGTSSSSSSRKLPTISAAALKSIFKPSVNNNGNGRLRPGFFPELRRTKSFSASKNEAFSGVFEPQRRSCDVRSSLWNLFNQDEHRNPTTEEATVSAAGEIEAEQPRKSSVREPVFETKEEGEAESDHDNGVDFEIVNDSSEVTGERTDEIVEEEEAKMEEEEEEEEDEEEEVKAREEELKPMKDHIDLDSQAKKPSVRAKGSFWSAASVFSKTLQKWRQKQKIKKQRSNGGGSARLPVEKPIGRQLRDTQSEIADYGFGRRSCDTDPRFSLDAGRFSLDAGRFSVDIGRISLDDPRFSFDEPRASWDGYMNARTTARLPPPPSMLSVVEDAPPLHRHVPRSDMQIPVEEQPSDPVVPGGSAQTRDYYTDSSSRRRKSLDRSSSTRKSAATAAEMEELKAAITMDSSNGSSVRDECSVETTEAGVYPKGNHNPNNNNNNNNKKWRRWSKWSILGFIYRKSVVKYEEEEERYSRWNGTVERSMSETWPELRNGGGGRMTRSNSNVSWRSSGSGRKSNGGWLERNKSCRYSPKDSDNGMLGFYVGPMNGGRRSTGQGGWDKMATTHGHSLATTVMRLY